MVLTVEGWGHSTLHSMKNSFCQMGTFFYHKRYLQGIRPSENKKMTFKKLTPHPTPPYGQFPNTRSAFYRQAPPRIIDRRSSEKEMMQNSERLKVFEIPIETTLVFKKQN